MTLYEKILTFDVEAMASFIQELIYTTEEGFLADMSKQGYDASIVRVHPDVQLASNISMLLQEVEDADS